MRSPPRSSPRSASAPAACCGRKPSIAKALLAPTDSPLPLGQATDEILWQQLRTSGDVLTGQRYETRGAGILIGAVGLGDKRLVFFTRQNGELSARGFLGSDAHGFRSSPSPTGRPHHRIRRALTRLPGAADGTP